MIQLAPMNRRAWPAAASKLRRKINEGRLANLIAARRRNELLYRDAEAAIVVAKLTVYGWTAIKVERNADGMATNVRATLNGPVPPDMEAAMRESMPNWRLGDE